MIWNDQELEGTQKRIARFHRLLAQFRASTRPDEFPAVAGGYRSEIERMQKEVLEYLTRHVSESVRT
jgi:hypothetical protein